MLTISNWAEVDSALEEGGKVDLEISEISCCLGRKLHELIARYGERLTSLGEERREIESAIESFCLRNKAEFGAKRSKQFHHGRISFRMAERIEIPEEFEEAVIATLKKLGYQDCIETRERLDRNALKKLADGDLTRCGIRRTKEDHFRIDPDLNLISEKLGKQKITFPHFAVDLQKLDRAIRRKEQTEAA